MQRKGTFGQSMKMKAPLTEYVVSINTTGLSLSSDGQK